MKKRKFLALTLACALGAGTMAGCGSDGGSQTGANADGAAVTGTETDTADSGEVVTLKWIQVGNGMPDNYDAWLEQINPYLEEKIGVNVDMEIVPWGDWDNRRSVIANSGEAFDILFTDLTRYNSEVETGLFMDITEMIPTVTPDLYEMITEQAWTAAAVGGEIYAVPNGGSTTNYFIWDVDMAEKYNIDYKNIHTFEDLAPALQTIAEGEKKAPYRMSKNGADWLLNYYDQLGAGLPALGIRYDDAEKKVVNPLEEPEIAANLELIHQMYKDGVINGDAPTSDDSPSYRTFFTASGWSSAAKTNWGPNNGIENCEAIQFGEPIISNTSVCGSMSGIYAGCQYPEKALQLIELVNTDSKVRDWFFYGVEGENFQYTADGKVEKLNSEWPMAGYTQGVFSNVSWNAALEVNEWEEVDQLNASATPSVMLGFDMDTSKVETELANCRAVYEKYKSELWTGAQDPKKLIPKILEELEVAGWETIRAEAQAQVDAAK